jgi:hypothetical protein
MYQPTLGRFLSRDPLSANGVDVLTDTGFYGDRLAAMRANPWYYGGNSENAYIYVRSSPVNQVDPSGLWELRCRPLGAPANVSCQRHCWVQCDGHSYSLLNKDGVATPVIDDKSDINKGDLIKAGKDRCKCIAAAFQDESGKCPYDFNDCNSNWFAMSLLACCNIKPGRPTEAYGWNDCKRYWFKCNQPRPGPVVG